MNRFIQPRGIILLGLCATTLAATLITGERLFSILFYFLAGSAAFSLLLVGSSLTGLKVIRETSTNQARVGEIVEETLRITRGGILPRWGIEIRDMSTLPGHAVTCILPAQVRKTWERIVRTPSTRRGEYILGPMHIRGLDPFGFFAMERIYAKQTRIMVLPQVFLIRGIKGPAGILPGGDALHKRSQQITTNAVSIREYQPGDPFNRIHWPSTAKTGRVMSREYELDPLADVYLMPDLDRSQQVEWMGARTGTAEIYPAVEEYIIATTASLAAHYLRSGRSSGLICYPSERKSVIADRGERQQHRLLETLAVLEAGGSISVRDMLIFERENLPRGATIVVITAATKDDWLLELSHLQGRGMDVIALLIDASSFGGRPGVERLGERLNKIGVANEIISRSDYLPPFFLPGSPDSFPTEGLRKRL